MDFAGRDPWAWQDVPEIENERLDAVFETYEDCDDVMPFVNRIFWLVAVKEAVGRIPFELSYTEILGLVWYSQEATKKVAYENWKLSQENAKARMQSARRR